MDNTNASGWLVDGKTVRGQLVFTVGVSRDAGMQTKADAIAYAKSGCTATELAQVYAWFARESR